MLKERNQFIDSTIESNCRCIFRNYWFSLLQCSWKLKNMKCASTVAVNKCNNIVNIKQILTFQENQIPTRNYSSLICTESVFNST